MMNAELITLKRLQETDDHIAADRKILAEGEAILKNAQATLKAQEDKLQALRQKQGEMSARHRELEAEVADLSVKKKNNENRQMSVKNDGEYQALLKEADYLAGRIGQTEDEILDLLDRLERLDIEISDQALLVTETTQSYLKLEQQTGAAQERGRARLGGLESERKDLAGALAPERLKHYDDLIKNRAGRAVTAAGDGMCLACRLSFPPQLYNDLQRNEKILVCPNCARILYWAEHPDFKAEGQDQKPEAPAA